MINSNNFFLVLIWANIFVPEKTVKKTVKSLSALSRQVMYLLNLLIKIVDQNNP